MGDYRMIRTHGGITADRLLAVRRPDDEKEVKVPVLGVLAWTSVADCRIAREDLEAALRASNLDLKFMPRNLNPRDAFRRATAFDVEKHQEIVPGRYLNMLIRDVEETPNEMVKHVVREVIDEKNHRLDYRSVVKLTLRTTVEVKTAKTSGRRPKGQPKVTRQYSHQGLEIERLVPDLYEPEEALIARVVKDFAINEKHYDGTHMRIIVNSVLDACRTVSVRPSGGVYFIPHEYEQTVEGLRVFLNNHLDKKTVTNNHSRLYRVPVVDSQEQRDNIAESLEDQVKEASRSLVGEMTEVIKTGKNIRTKTAENYLTRARDLMRLVKEYEDLLQSEITGVQATLELTEKQALKLMEQVGEEGEES